MLDYIILLLWNWHPNNFDDCWGSKRVLIKNDENVDENSRKAILSFCKLHNMDKDENNIPEYMLNDIEEYKATELMTEFSYDGSGYIDGVQVRNYIEVIAEYTNVYIGV